MSDSAGVDAVSGALEVVSSVDAQVMGVGVDVVYIPTFAEQLNLPGSTFALSFTGAERRECARLATTSGNVEQHLAVRWAAKEAFYKAWTLADAGDEIPGAQMEWSQIEVVKDRWGRPFIRLHDPLDSVVTQALERRFGVDGDVPGHAVWHLSLSHDGPVAQAFVVAEWRSA